MHLVLGADVEELAALLLSPEPRTPNPRPLWEIAETGLDTESLNRSSRWPAQGRFSAPKLTDLPSAPGAST
jgi:hypothetical protein